MSLPLDKYNKVYFEQFYTKADWKNSNHSTFSPIATVVNDKISHLQSIDLKDENSFAVKFNDAYILKRWYK